MKRATEAQNNGLLTTDCLAGYEEFPEKEKLLCPKRDLVPKLQLKPGDHSTLDHPGTGMRAMSPEVSRCCNRVCQAASSGRLQFALDQQNAHADDLQIP